MAIEKIKVASHHYPCRLTSRWWLLPLTVISFVVFPLALLAVFGLILAEQFWAKILSIGMLLAHVNLVNRTIRKPLNDNVQRLESAQTALQLVAPCHQPIALFLRSFAFSAGYHDNYASFGFVELMEPTIRDTGIRPCALGTTLPLPPQHGVVMVNCADDDWWANFKTLASQAAVIFVFPETSESLMREVIYLKDVGALQKTMLVMPPTSIPILAWGPEPWLTSGGDDKAKRNRWSSTRETWHTVFDVSLPEYSSRGALIELDKLGNVIRSTSLRQGKPPDDTKAIERDEPSVYAVHYQVLFSEIWQKILARRQFFGNPLSVVWRELVTSPLVPRWSHYWKPPGDNGTLRRNVKMMAAYGWAPLPLVLILLLIAWIGDWVG